MQKVRVWGRKPEQNTETGEFYRKERKKERKKKKKERKNYIP